MKKIIAVMIVVAMIVGAVPAMAKMSSIEEGLYHMAGKDLPGETQARYKREAWDKQHHDNYARVHAQAAKESKTGWMIVGFIALMTIIGIPGVINGIKKKVVYFYSGEDLAVNIVPLLIAISAIFVPEQYKIITLISSIAISVGFNFLTAHICNPCSIFMATSVGAGRVIIGYVVPVMLLCLVLGGSGKAQGEDATAFQVRSLREGITRLLSFAGLIWFIRELVNGGEVERDRMHHI